MQRRIHLILAAEYAAQLPSNGCWRAIEVHRREGDGVPLDYGVFVKCHLDCRVQEQPGSLIRSETEALLGSHIGVHLIKVVTLETGTAKARLPRIDENLVSTITRRPPLGDLAGCQFLAFAGPLPDLVARLLAKAVEHRLSGNLTRGYRNREMVLTRVRGSIDVLTTEAHLLLSRGEVFCRSSPSACTKALNLSFKPSEFRCVKHQKPEISNRDASD
jgi:hypothetical protein